jgi:hypothetical protein
MKPKFPTCALLAFLALAPFATAQITDDFTPGHGLADGGTYTGVAENGWTTPWLLKRPHPSVMLDRDVLDSNPLIKGGGNHLVVSGVATSAGIWGIARQFAPFPNREYNYVRRDRSHVIRLNLRFDDLSGWSSGEDVAVGDGQSANENNGIGPQSSFMLRAHYSDTGGARGNHWAVYDGQRDGTFDRNRYVDTGIPLVAGVTYTITLRIRPATRSWIATIEDGTRSFTSGTLGFRAGGYGTGILTIIRTTNESSDATTFSLDNVVIDDGD